MWKMRKPGVEIDEADHRECRSGNGDVGNIRELGRHDQRTKGVTDRYRQQFQNGKQCEVAEI